MQQPEARNSYELLNSVFNYLWQKEQKLNNIIYWVECNLENH